MDRRDTLLLVVLTAFVACIALMQYEIDSLKREVESVESLSREGDRNAVKLDVLLGQCRVEKSNLEDRYATVSAIALRSSVCPGK